MTFLTEQEKKVILFLVGTLLLGIGIKTYKKQTAYNNFDPISFDDKTEIKTLAESIYNKANTTIENQNNIDHGNAEEKNYHSQKEIININTAGKQELTQLPKVGAVTAERIIRFREDFGPFNTKEDLLKIKGIGPKTLEKIKPNITLE